MWFGKIFGTFRTQSLAGRCDQLEAGLQVCTTALLLAQGLCFLNDQNINKPCHKSLPPRTEPLAIVPSLPNCEPKINLSFLKLLPLRDVFTAMRKVAKVPQDFQAWLFRLAEWAQPPLEAGTVGVKPLVGKCPWACLVTPWHTHSRSQALGLEIS